jgi:hypothetical protein
VVQEVAGLEYSRRMLRLMDVATVDDTMALIDSIPTADSLATSILEGLDRSDAERWRRCPAQTGDLVWSGAFEAAH